MPSTYLNKTTLFGNSVNLAKKAQKAKFVNVGGAGDCGFRSIAAGIVDNYLANPRSNQALYLQFLEPLLKKYPFRQPPGRSFTPVERAQALLENPACMADIINNLSKTLREIAVDQLKADSEKYPGSFVEDNENTSPEAMRKQTTWIDEDAVAALSDALHFPIDILVAPTRKEAFLRLSYGHNFQQPAGDLVTIQLQHKHYIPQVSQPALFERLSTQVLQAPKVPVQERAPDPSLVDIIARIRASDQRLLDDFNNNLNRLTTIVAAMIAAGEIDKDKLKGKLIDIYVSGLGNSDYLRGRIKAVGTEHGNQQFFAEVVARAGGSTEPVALHHGSHDQQVVSELVHAISRAISIGQMDAEQVYNAIENDSKRMTASSIS